MTHQILSTRLRIPQPRKHYLIRRELFHTLDTMDDLAITLVKGGAGSGKTTLLTSYIRERPDKDFHWISLDDSCNHPLFFWNYVVESLTSILSVSKTDILDYLHTNIRTQPMEELLLPLLNAISPCSGFYLVLDDFHLIKDESLLQGFSFFLDNLPAGLHLLLLSRQEPSLYLAKYEMDGKLLRVEEADLSLSPQESCDFLIDTLSLSLADPILANMTEAAEGWIGGLQLIAAAFRYPDLQNVKTPSRLMKDYLTAEIFSNLSEEEQLFLVHTAPFSYFNKELCQSLLPDIDFHGMLENLIDKNLMLQCLDPATETYRYHSLWGEYLKLHFEKQPAEHTNRLYQKGARIFLAQNDYEETFRILFLLKDYDSIIPLLLKYAHVPEILRYIAFIPGSQGLDNFDFLYQKLFYHYSCFNFSACMDIYNQVLPLMEKDIRYHGFNGLQVLLSNEGLNQEITIFSVEEIHEMDLLDTTKILLLIRNAIFFFYQAHYLQALQCLDACKDRYTAPVVSYILYFNRTLKSQVYEEMGLLTKALRMQQVTEQMLKDHQSLSALYSTNYITITGIYLKQMRLEDAWNSLSASGPLIHASTVSLYASYQYNLAEYYFLSGEQEKAAEIANTLLNIEVYQDVSISAGLVKYLHHFRLLTPEIKAMYMKNYEHTKPSSRNQAARMVYIDLLADSDKVDQAITLLDDILGICRKEKIHLKMVEASLKKIKLLLARKGEDRKIFHLYQEALYYGWENKIRMPFYLEKEVVAAMERSYKKQLSALDSIGEKDFHQEMLGYCGPISSQILSERELEVLECLSQGITNKDIAEQLCVSLSTVKTHIIHIYQKLEVNSRMAAVEEGRKFGLIP